MMKAAFISRDGVINQPVDGGVTHRTQLQLVEGSVDAVVRMCKAGYTVVMVTHQPGLSRGLFDLDELEAIHAIINSAVEDQGGQISAIFYCPHDEDDHCYCRPPATGLLDVAAIELDCDLRQAPYFCRGLATSHDALNNSACANPEVAMAQAKGCQPIICGPGQSLAQAVTDLLSQPL